MSAEPGPAWADDVKACCAAAYGTDAVALLLGTAYHPGGLALTRRLAGALSLAPGQRVLDVAAGPGATARLLALEHEVLVDGVDLGEHTVLSAREATVRAGLAERVAFRVGDAEQLPVTDAGYDALVCECALCTFPDKTVAAAEFARALRPGGRVGITDVTVAPEGLPAELAGITGWVACIADARPSADYEQLLVDAGLRPLRRERHDTAIARMVDEIEARIGMFEMTAPERLAAAGVDAEAVRGYLVAARRAVEAGTIGYTLLVAEKPAA
ncbi:class I SAM-dependent methyltransferase [Salinactinospora qingdaonensis]|uniref:class I SAM-dependent methyltransferase n=1 Tax=Salinactinospora qingdaonensis TaxID=702744 RepID=UPI0031E801F7